MEYKRRKDKDDVKRNVSEAALKRKRRNLIKDETFEQTVNRIRAIFNQDVKKNRQLNCDIHVFNYYEGCIYNLIKREYFIKQMFQDVKAKVTEARERGDLND